MANQHQHPSSCASDATVGAVAWYLPMSALISNDNRATATSAVSANTEYLWWHHFGFTIPTEATITGVKVAIECHASENGAENNVQDKEVSLVLDGVIGGEGRALSGTNWELTDTDFEHGGIDDIWGIDPPLTPADINNSDFGVVLQAQILTEAEVIAYVDACGITVYYTEAGTLKSQTVWFM